MSDVDHGRRGLVALGVLTVIVIASILPAPDGAEGPLSRAVSDLAHVGGYGVLAATAAWYLDARWTSTAAVIAAAIGLATVAGGAVELLQAPIPSRHASVRDVALNALGSAVGALVAVWATRSGRSRP